MQLRRHPHLHAATRVAVVTLLAAGAIAACGGDGDPGPALSSDGEAGREVIRTSGCAACHGRNGEGGPGPAFTGLFGSTVELADGTSVVADADYLAESIREPGAKVVAGYGFPMPEIDLSDEEIELVIAYVEELADTEATR